MGDHDGEAELVEQAFRAHRDDVQRYLQRRIGDRHDAEELTQAVFAEAAERLPALACPPDSMLAWLYTVAERRFIDEIRRRTRRRQRLHLLTRDEAVERHDYGSGLAEAIRSAVGDLPPDQRSIVVARLLEDRPFAEIAERLDITEAAAKMRFVRAIAVVRSRLADQELGPRDG